METHDFEREELPHHIMAHLKQQAIEKADEVLAKAQMILDFDGDIPEPEMPPYSSLR